MIRPTLIAVPIVLLLAPCVQAQLASIVLDGQELHESLVTERIDEVERLHVPRAVLRENPQLSDEAEFVEAITRAGSQGQIGSDGVTAALYALYRAEEELGLYGLEAASTVDANRFEHFLHETWALNASLDRAQVHRAGNVIVVVWTDGVSADCWKAVNQVVSERLIVP